MRKRLVVLIAICMGIVLQGCGYRAWDGYIGALVWNDVNGNGERDEGEAPLEAIRVMFLDPADKTFEQILLTDEDGRTGIFQPGGCWAMDVVVIPPGQVFVTTPVLVLGAKCTEVEFGLQIVEP